jgi:HEAT repeat protein
MRRTISLFLALSCLPILVHASDPGRKARQTLETAMADSNPDHRKEAVIALSLIGPGSDAFKLLTDALASDKDVEVRVAACASLAETKDSRAIEPLLKALNDETPEISFGAAKALFAMGDATGKAVILDVLGKEKKTNSGLITKEKRDALRMLKTPGVLFKMAAKEGLGLVPLPGLGIGIASAQAIMNDSGVSARGLAALMLAKETDEESLKALRDAIYDSDWSVRAAAIHSLALRDKPEVKDDLVLLFDDKKIAVRYRAAAAYLRLDQLSKEPRSTSQPSQTGKSRR